MNAIPRYRAWHGPALFAAGYRPFFLLSGLWAALAVPLWVAVFANALPPPPMSLPPVVWHVHEMVFGFGAATVAGFLLTAIPNWTGRMPLSGLPLAGLAALWLAGRAACLTAGLIGPVAAMIADLAFPAVFLGVVAREIIAGRNWRNLPMLGALAALLIANFLVHNEALGLGDTAALGNRLGVATLLALISLIGGRIIPSFTRNWLVKQRPEITPPAPFGMIDRAALIFVIVALAFFVIAPDGRVMPWAALAAGCALALRLRRWRGWASRREPLLLVLHLGYGWLAFGFLVLGLATFLPWLPPTTALHALTVGAIGTMTLAVMTRATLGHSGRKLTAGAGTTAIYTLVTLAAVFRLSAPLAGAQYLFVLALAGAAWSAAFVVFAGLYGPLFIRARA
ncbi:NnrS family protein [Acidiphilium sp.]|uniref:NnrS family protein n=1 Tax=Acidiphilium sp. TaxID=527 RepID=UPI002587BC8C|nr:NnrS family protein [Acidiphilium sp.]